MSGEPMSDERRSEIAASVANHPSTRRPTCDSCTIAELLAEVDRLAAENERLRSVFDAAQAWHAITEGVFLPGVTEWAALDALAAALASGESDDPGRVMSRGVELIATERARQVEQEGYSAAHDAAHNDNSLSLAASCYVTHVALGIHGEATFPPEAWPWRLQDWKPTNDPVRMLVKAGALIAAEIDRLSAPETENGE